MEVLKSGNLDLYARNYNNEKMRPKEFICDMCGCVFVANRTDYHFILHKIGIYANCPTCGTDVRFCPEIYDYEC